MTINSPGRCFLKIPSEASPLGLDSALDILNTSYFLQRRIRSQSVITARRKIKDQHRYFFEYPMLDHTLWQPLTPTVFRRQHRAILIQICRIIDYLHLLDLVHCDLKFENFLVKQEADGPRIVLIDLDSLAEADSSPQAKIIGTPDHIAPEVLDNEIICWQSDNYSLGRSLARYLDGAATMPTTPDITEDEHTGLQNLAAALSAERREDRPLSLLDALFGHGVIDEATMNREQQTLLVMLLATHFLNHRSEINDDPRELQAFIRTKSKIIGIPNELIDDMADTYGASPSRVWRAFTGLIENAEIRRFVDYWQVACDFPLLERAYMHLDPMTMIAPAAADDGADIGSIIEGAERLRAAGASLKPYLLYRHAERRRREVGRSDDDTMRDINLAMGDLAVELQQPAEAFAHKETARSLLTPNSAPYFRLTVDLASLAINLRRIPDADAFITAGLDAATSPEAAYWRLELSRYRAWLLSADGKYDESRHLLESIEREAVEMNLFDIQAKTHNQVASLARMQGDYETAQRQYIRSIDIAENRGLAVEAASSLGYLSYVLFQLARYEEAVAAGKKAMSILEATPRASASSTVYLYIADSYLRLGEFQKARYWQQRYFASLRGENILTRITGYYLCLGWQELNRGRVNSGLDYLHKGREILSSSPSFFGLGPAYQLLAEAALYRGESDKAAEYCRQAISILAEMNDHSIQAECRLTEALNDFYYGRNSESVNLWERYDELMQRRCIYYAALCLFHIALANDVEEGRKTLRRGAAVLAQVTGSPVPVFRCLDILNHCFGSEEVSVDVHIRALKDIYKILEKAGLLFLAALVCDRIAAKYNKLNKTRLASRFLDNGAKLVRRLGNEPLHKHFETQIEYLPSGEDNQTSRMTAIYHISEILRDIDDYETALNRIVQFAADETGAERGALLLYSPDSSNLQVKSFVNCDEASLEDITRFSHSIPSLVTGQTEPLSIENALQDPRTKDYKSVIMHNIHSVVCTPIRSGKQTLGVLYLDHQTIPALFDTADLTFINALANFIAVIMKTIQDYRSVSMTSQRRAQNLMSLGSGQKLVTRNVKMEKLLAGLANIAKTNADVLITGESGTGKELIAEMIHDLSLRSNKHMVRLNCSAIAQSLSESELFGVVAGTATDVRPRKGKFAEADGGTLFMDEIADMPMDIQAKVLRAVENQQFEPVGSNRVISTDIRFIYATNRDIPLLMKFGEFRKDLFYRINTITIELPPLRERHDDIELLVGHFVKLMVTSKEEEPRFPREVIELLTRYDWPGNVRELKNIVERLCILRRGQQVMPVDLPGDIIESARKQPRDKAETEHEEKARIEHLLAENRWNQSQVARIMDIPLSNLRRRIKKYGIKKPF